MFKNEKVQLNLPGWKTRGDIFTEADLHAINTTRKMYDYEFIHVYLLIIILNYFQFFFFSLFKVLHSCNSILVRIMIPPYEIVSLLQLGKCDASVFKNIISDEIIVDQRFSTFFTVDGLIEMIVFLSDKITRVSKNINYFIFHFILYFTYKLLFYINPLVKFSL